MQVGKSQLIGFLKVLSNLDENGSYVELSSVESAYNASEKKDFSVAFQHNDEFYKIKETIIEGRSKFYTATDMMKQADQNLPIDAFLFYNFVADTLEIYENGGVSFLDTTIILRKLVKTIYKERK